MKKKSSSFFRFTTAGTECLRIVQNSCLSLPDSSSRPAFWWQPLPYLAGEWPSGAIFLPETPWNQKKLIEIFIRIWYNIWKMIFWMCLAWNMDYGKWHPMTKMPLPGCRREVFPRWQPRYCAAAGLRPRKLQRNSSMRESPS